MSKQSWGRWQRTVGLALLPLLLLGCSLAAPADAQAQVRLGSDQLASGIRLEHLGAGYRASGTLGFALRETTIQEQLYRRGSEADRALVWSAEFQSRWTLNEAQLERWSAQAIGLLVDELDPNVRLAGWERLDASDVGDQRVAYRYTLATPTGQRAGEATLVVFARGEQVGLTGTAALGAAPVDATMLARVLDTRVGG